MFARSRPYDALPDVLVLEPTVGLRVLHATEFGELLDARRDRRAERER